MTATIHPITSKPTDAELLVIARRFAAIRAIHRMTIRLKTDLARANTDWKRQISEAMTAMESRLGDVDRQRLEPGAKAALGKSKLTAADKRNLQDVADRYVSACDGLAEVTRLAAEKQKDKAARTEQIDKFVRAEGELKTYGADESREQGRLFSTEELHGAWASAETRTLTYTALHFLEAAGHPLDAYQSALLGELAAEGMSAMDLGISLDDAVETDGEYPDEEDETEEIDIDAVLMD